MKKNRTYGLMENICLLKMIKIMRFTIFILLLSLTQTFAVNTYSQQTKLSLDMRNVRIEEVIDKIEKSSEFFFMYNRSMIDADRKVDIKVEGKSVNQVLDKIFANTEISYSINDRQILLTNKSMSGINGSVSQQQKSVMGKVTDATGAPLPGVTIVIKGTAQGTITDSEGNYNLTNVPAQATLVYSFIGMKTQEIPFAGNASINITMDTEISGIDEVVVIGYGSRAKRDVTTAISSIDSKSISKVITMNPEMAMQGRMTGVHVSGNSGNLMDHPTIRIRGVNTWGVADPLYVIDGIPIQSYGSGIEAKENGMVGYMAGPINIMSMVDPNDIESISVLKDASAAAIYGVRAANGVILITTKKGTGDKPRVEFSMRTGIQNMEQHLDVLNTQQYAQHIRDVYASDPTLSVSDLNKEVMNPNSPKYLGNNPTYDWQNELKNQNAPLQEYSMRLIGGTGKTDYYLSLGYAKQEGTFKGNSLERFNGSFKINAEVTKWFLTGINYRISAVDGLNEVDDPMYLTYAKLAAAPPWQPITDASGPYGYAQTVNGFMPDGTFNSDPIYGSGTQYNYQAIIALNDVRFNALRNMGNAYIELQPLKNLKLRGQVSVDANSRFSSAFGNYEEGLFNNHLGDPRGRGGGNSVGSLENHDVRDFNLVKELSLSYKNSFGDHNFDMLLNVMDQQFNAKILGAQTEYMSTANEFLRVIPPSSFTKAESSLSRSALVGTMGRLGYNYKTKYYLDMTVRRDGSARFSPEKRWGVFPSISAAWRVTGESALQESRWLTDLKIRTGWGQLGNQEVRDLAYLSIISTNPVTSWGTSANGRGNIISGATVFGMPTTSLEWEKTTTSNIGIDAVFHNNLNFSVEYYNKLTSGILQDMTIPTSVGVTMNPVANIGSVRNSGIEISLNYSNQIGEFAYSVGGNLTTVKNVVEETYNHIPLGTIEEGESMYYIKGYKMGGIFQTQAEVDAWKAAYSDDSYQTAKVAPGDVYFQDLRSAPTNPGEFYSNTKDGIINNYDMVNLGKTIPGYYYGLNLSLEWKGIDVSAQLTGVGDVMRYNEVRAQLEYSPSTSQNVSTKVLEAWTINNPSQTVPRLIGGDPASNFRRSDMFVEDASYLRVSNVQLGYSLPKKILGLTNNHMSNFRLYGGASNLYTITDYSGLDPENDYYPSPRIFFMGLNVSF